MNKKNSKKSKESNVSKESLLEYIEVVEDIEFDTEQMSFWCKMMNQHRKYHSRFAVVSNHYLRMFKDDSEIDCTFTEEMDKIAAVYINKERDQLVLKRNSEFNIVIKTKSALEVLRTVYAIRYYDEIPVYEVKEDDLCNYLSVTQLPADKYLIPDETSERIIIELMR